jgi:hypothetical protein
VPFLLSHGQWSVQRYVGEALEQLAAAREETLASFPGLVLNIVSVVIVL